jgi:Siphovirus-type tail component, C-terminal domain
MPTLEFDIPFTIEAPFGDLNLNQQLSSPERNYIINAKSSVGRRRIRANTDDIPQGDGEIFHRRFTGGYEMQLAVQLWQNDAQVACDDILCQMRDELYGILWSMLNPPDDDGRLLWTPSCDAGGRRMLDRARLLSLEDPGEDQETGAAEITFVIDTPFPYAISLAQQVVNLNGAGGTITNDGNVDFWPVIKMNSDGGTITNNTTGFEISIGSGCLGAGSFIEMDTFRDTAYVDGDQANAKPCIDALVTDFFPLIPGVNQIDTSVSCDFLVNDAFA